MTNVFKLKTIIPTEHEEQKALFDWQRAHLGRFPELSMLFAIPNQAPGSGGHRLRQYYASEGMQKGVPDMFLAVPRKGYHGLFIELKRTRREKPAPEQMEWLDRLAEQGYQSAICHGCDSAIETITNYLREK